MLRLATRLGASTGSNWAAALAAGTKAPETFCSVFSLTSCLREEGPVLQPGAHSRASHLLGLPPNPISPWLNDLSSERRVMYIHKCASLGRPTPDKQAQGEMLQLGYTFRRESEHVLASFPLCSPCDICASGRPHLCPQSFERMKFKC